MPSTSHDRTNAPHDVRSEPRSTPAEAREVAFKTESEGACIGAACGVLVKLEEQAALEFYRAAECGVTESGPAESSPADMGAEEPPTLVRDCTRAWPTPSKSGS